MVLDFTKPFTEEKLFTHTDLGKEFDKGLLIGKYRIIKEILEKLLKIELNGEGYGI